MSKENRVLPVFTPIPLTRVSPLPRKISMPTADAFSIL